LLIGLSGLADSIDGALAIGTGRASQRGFVLDSVADRLTEAAYAGALWAAGAPGWLAVAFGALCWLPDYLRARAGQAGIDRTGPVSVWERPTRVAMAGMTLGGAGVVAGLVAGSGSADLVVPAGTAVGVVLGLVGTVQLGLWFRRVLAGPPASGGAAGPGGS
jgi:CDP-diacylglycerol--glycerol-3-phosphate 3-phosphatidyltransferase